MAKRNNYKPIKVYSENDSSLIEESVPLPPALEPTVAPEKEIVIKTETMPDATEAHMRHDNSQPSAVIVTSHCGVGTQHECIHKDDCPILDALDDVILKFLDTNVVIGTEVKWCGQYQPRRPFSTGFILGEENK